MLYQTFAQVAKLFLFMLTGYILTRKKILPDQAAKCLSVFLVWISCPALYFYSFATQFTVAQLRSSAALIGVCIVGLAASYLIAVLTGRFVTKDKYTRDVYTYSLCVPNYGYMGYVLVLALMGEAALLKFQIFVIPVTVFMLTKGYAMLLKQKVNAKNLLNPMMIAMVAGMIVGLLGIEIPEILLDTMKGASDCMGPLSMTLAGCVIAGFDLKKVLSSKAIYITVAVKMILMPLLVVAVGRLIALPQEYLSMLLIFQCLSVGLNSVVYPSTVGEDCSFGAGLAVVCNCTALITVPIFMSLI